MARPRLPENSQKRTKQVIFRLTEAEYHQLSVMAARAGFSVNTFARYVALARAKRIIVKTHARSDPALIKRLERIGHNLNQLTRYSHCSGQVPSQIHELCAHIHDIVHRDIEEINL